ncbi:secondary thiamine-phosphate synthase enzyme YjbQ [Candidatus Micrarchaeota archaeon]|nr:secondary thiamine-phosphate synthase enzyme YjbQ [Candidatus Micrarchaeota archaeon]MBU1681606.1 secondary thiamine-phosphate synthase enzyme YjbQ [Candidatus Micrarchaeota archaeon]
MKSKTEYLTLNTEKKIQIIRITDQVENVVSKSGVKDGLVLVNPMHITAAVVVNDNESGLHKDYLRVLENLVPYEGEYRHNDTGEDNGAAHIWRQMMGHQVVLPITNGKLDFGPWEQIFYFEFDGMRQKRILIKVIGE